MPKARGGRPDEPSERRPLTAGVATLYEGVRPEGIVDVDATRRFWMDRGSPAKSVKKWPRRSPGLARHGVVPRLDAVLVGDDPASQVYVGSKAKTLRELGHAV